MGNSVFCVKSVEFKDSIRLLNRTSFQEGHLCLEWSASGFELEFSGDGIAVYFEKNKTQMPIYIAAFVDGVRRNFAVNSKEVLVIDGLENRRHSFRLLKITEPRYCDADPRLFVTEIRLFGEGAEVKAAPVGKNTKISFFGDSITCGYGVLGKETDDEFFTHQEDVTRSYAFLTAEKLKADWQIVAVSGQGVVLNSSGERGYPISQYFEHCSAFLKNQFDHSSWQPQAVVINIGTNDCNAKADAGIFRQAADRLLSQVRSAYPLAHIVWMFGLMGGSLAEVIRDVVEEKKLSDKNISFLPVPCISREKNQIGARWHPNVNGQKMAAELLTLHLLKVAEI